MNNFSNELKLIFLLSQIHPSKKELRQLLQKGINETHFLDLAFANGVFPLVCKVLNEHSIHLPNNDYKKTFQQTVTDNFYISAQLLHIIHLLKLRNISIIPIKGPLLSQHAYQDISLRAFSDLDILAKEEDLIDISNILIALGYKSEHDIAALHHPHILNQFSDISFTHQVSGLSIELHWKLLKSASAELAQVPNLFKNAIPIDFQNTSLLSLPLEEEFLYLCVHAAKHRFERVEWMNDLNRLYELYHETYDWDKILSIADKEGFTVPYLLGLYILYKTYKRDIIHTKSRKHMFSKKISRFYHKVLTLHTEGYVLKDKKQGIRWKELSFSIALESRLDKKLKHVLHLAFPLYIDDILAVKNRPKYLYFLYYFKRIQRYFKS